MGGGVDSRFSTRRLRLEMGASPAPPCAKEGPGLAGCPELTGHGGRPGRVKDSSVELRTLVAGGQAGEGSGAQVIDGCWGGLQKSVDSSQMTGSL